MTFHSLVPSITLSLSKSSIRSWSCHRHHHLIDGLFFCHYIIIKNMRVLYFLFTLMIIPTSQWNTITEFL